jgi:hypothetical protein
MKLIRSALGVVIGLACYFALGWALSESALAHELVGAGLLLWLVAGCVGGALLIISVVGGRGRT